MDSNPPDPPDPNPIRIQLYLDSDSVLPLCPPVGPRWTPTKAAPSGCALGVSTEWRPVDFEVLFYFYFSCILATPEAGSNREYIVILACTEAIIIAMLAPLQLIWLGATTRTVLVPGCGGFVGGDGGMGGMHARRRARVSEGLAASRTPLYLGYGGERRPEAEVRHGATTRRRGPVKKSCGIFFNTFLWPQRIPGPALGTVVSLALTTMRTAWCPFMPQQDQPRGPFWTQRVWYFKVDRRSLGRERGAS